MKQKTYSKDFTFSKYRSCLKQAFLEAHERNIHNWSTANAAFCLASSNGERWQGSCHETYPRGTEYFTPGELRLKWQFPSAHLLSAAFAWGGCPVSSSPACQWTNQLDQFLPLFSRILIWDQRLTQKILRTGTSPRGWSRERNVSPASFHQLSHLSFLAVKNPRFLHQLSITWSYRRCLGHRNTSNTTHSADSTFSLSWQHTPHSLWDTPPYIHETVRVERQKESWDHCKNGFNLTGLLNVSEGSPGVPTAAVQVPNWPASYGAVDSTQIPSLWVPPLTRVPSPPLLWETDQKTLSKFSWFVQLVKSWSSKTDSLNLSPTS